MDIFGGKIPFNWGIKNENQVNVKVGQRVKYKGDDYIIKRIDRHVYPICLGGGIRTLEKDIEILEDE